MSAGFGMIADPSRAVRGPAAHAWLARLLLWLALLCCAAAAHADNLVTWKPAGAFPPLNHDAPLVGLAEIDGRLLAASERTLWLLEPGAREWRRLPDDAASGRILGLARAGGATWLLRGDAAGARGVERLRIEGGQLRRQALPGWPQPLASARVGALAERLYVAGVDAGGAARLLALPLQAAATRWTPLPPWPGGGAPTALAAQNQALFVSVAAPGGDRLWRRDAEGLWQPRTPVPGRVLEGSVRALGQAHLLFLVAPPEAAPGAARLASYHTITDAWATPPVAEAAPARLAAGWGDGLLWAVPDAGGRSVFAAAAPEGGKYLLKWLDWTVIALYLVAMSGIGAWFYLREKRGSTSDFFVGGRSIPFWAAGVSLYATNTSSISFIAIPAKSFESNWQYLTNNLIAVLGLMFVAVWIVPLLRRLDLMSVFSYLETRFHPLIRMLASALCIAMQIGARMSVILFLPALAIATITGLDVVWSILIMGVFTILYTTLGGMKAVIWTDFVQVFVMFGGAIFAIGFIVWNIHGGVPEFLAVAMAEDKMKLFDFSFDLTKATVWGFLFLVLFDVILTFPKDQVLMQRVLSTRSDKEAGRSVWTFAAIMVPGGFFFYMIGTALYVYYKDNPERMNPLLPIDATFPLFIAAELPMGVTGLIIAGIFAAAMSTLSSIINSVSTLASVDFYEKLAKHPTPKKSVLFAEIVGVLVGLTGIGIALLLSRYDIHSLFDVSIELAGLLGGGFAGAYTLGMFTRRANTPGVAIGIFGSIVLTLALWSQDLVHPYFYLGISIMACIVIGYLASLLFPAPTRSLKGLTIYRDRE